MQLNSQKAFFALVRAGLWEQDVRLLPFGKIDMMAIYRLAEDQSVMGLVTIGLEHVQDNSIPKDVLLQFIGSTLQLEERNKEMNFFVAKLIKRLWAADIDTLLVKGQGIESLVTWIYTCQRRLSKKPRFSFALLFLLFTLITSMLNI